MDMDYIRVASGSSVAITAPTSSGGQNATIPGTLELTSATIPGASNAPRFVRVLPEAAAYINFGTDKSVSVTVLNGVAITPNEPTIFATRGYTYFAVVAKTATVVSVTPIEF